MNTGFHYVRVRRFGLIQTGLSCVKIEEVLLPSNGHGDNAVSAIAVSPGTTVGTIVPAGEKDWFSFDVSDGNLYMIETALPEPPDPLPDSVLALYDTAGTTVLIEDDDDGVGLASRIEWTAPDDGDYFAQVRGFSAYYTCNYLLDVSLLSPRVAAA